MTSESLLIDQIRSEIDGRVIDCNPNSMGFFYKEGIGDCQDTLSVTSRMVNGGLPVEITDVKRPYRVDISFTTHRRTVEADHQLSGQTVLFIDQEEDRLLGSNCFEKVATPTIRDLSRLHEEEGITPRSNYRVGFQIDEQVARDLKRIQLLIPPNN